MSEVFANGRTIVHAGDGHTQASGPPDVCKTPSPSGPTPLAYPNFAMDRDLADGSKSVAIEGHPVALASSNISTSSGDEAGSLGGLMSSKTKGKLTFGSSSLDVLIEGAGVVRFGDVTQHNGNTYNTVLAAKGKVGVAYGDDPLDQEECPICGDPKASHKIGPADDIVEKAKKLREALKDPAGRFRKAFVKPGGAPCKNGIVYGVLSCLCRKAKPYAGMSGTEFDDDGFKAGADVFLEVADGIGLIGVLLPPLPPPRSGFKSITGGGFTATTEAQWAATLERIQEAHANHNLRAAAPLTCVAPKLIQRCLADGHKPAALIEMWMALKPKKTLTIPRVLCIVPGENGGTKTEWQSRTFSDGDPVPSCTTCQVVCTEMLCNTGKPPCP